MPQTKAKAKKTTDTASTIDLRTHIHIKGARSNNLKDIELTIPKNKLVVVTGLSGSGKSSLIMDTLYAEGQRRYVESLSSYARQFLDRMKKPEVDYIKGICPAIAIEQKVTTSNARSTVGSLTEIYDYLRLLFARIGKTYDPKTGELVKKHEVSDVMDYINSFKKDTKVILTIPIQSRYERSLTKELDLLLQKGFTRVYLEGKLSYIEDLKDIKGLDLEQDVTDANTGISILIDRFVINDDEENVKRIADSVLTAFSESEGECLVIVPDKEDVLFNNRFELNGTQFLEPSHQLFNYNNPYGACPICEGYGRVLGIDPYKVFPNTSLSVYDGLIAPWRGEKGSTWTNRLISSADKFGFPIHRSYDELSEDQKELLWTGNEYFWGLNEFFAELKKSSYKIQNRVILARYRGKTSCHNCKGGRLRKEASYVKVAGHKITDWIHLPIEDLYATVNKLELNEYDAKVAARILLEVKGRLSTMLDVGLSYLSLDRLSATLSGGETQRINLTRTLGSNLTDSLYILDEPSIGLHPKDTEKLVTVLKKLRDLGNTVVVVEHEEDVIRNADHIIDVGPDAGIYGGEIVYEGSYKDFIKKEKKGYTAKYLRNDLHIPVPTVRRKSANKIKIIGASQHNLKNIDVTIPLKALTVISGVSGSGKTSLVKHILYPELKKLIGEAFTSSLGKSKGLSGDTKRIASVEMINQSPIGKSSRSNPVTYVKAYDSIRKLYADQQLSKIRGFAAKHFSFNVDAGRCENCNGEGEITVEMQFLADVKLLCEDCQGQRFKHEVLEVLYKGKSIYDVLNLSIEEAMTFFEDRKDIINKIKPLHDVGLGYVKLGQSSSTLSGGEAQRVKLASFLGQEGKAKGIFFIFDEPTTGLHFHDILKLMDALNALVEKGNTVLIVEHNLDVIKMADWLIDLGPVGGIEGGNLLYQGVPEGIVKVKESFTAEVLKDKL